jgi:Sporulation and spore germination/Immunoglobulin-like domain of bacterial spore germination
MGMNNNPNRSGPTDVETALRDAFERRAASVEIAPDALGDIRRRIVARRRWWRLSALRTRGVAMISMSTAVAASVAAIAIGIGSCAPTTPTRPRPNTAGGPTVSATNSPTRPTTKPSTNGPTGAAAARANVPVYYLGANDKLYREYHSTPVGNGTPAAKIRAAVVLMLDGLTAFDHDYSSQWPASASVRNVTVAGGVATVDLHGATVNGYDPAGNRAALQQLIWTATAFTGGSGVRLLFDGKPRTTLWASHQPVGGVLHRAAAVNALAPVWVIDPQQNAVSGRSVTLHLAGIVFEGAIQIRVRTSAGTQVVRQHVQLTAGAPAQGTATVTLHLSPGRYTIEAFYLPMNNSCDCPAGTDQHSFTVR